MSSLPYVFSVLARAESPSRRLPCFRVSFAFLAVCVPTAAAAYMSRSENVADEKISTYGAILSLYRRGADLTRTPSPAMVTAAVLSRLRRVLQPPPSLHLALVLSPFHQSAAHVRYCSQLAFPPLRESESSSLRLGARQSNITVWERGESKRQSKPSSMSLTVPISQDTKHTRSGVGCASRGGQRVIPAADYNNLSSPTLPPNPFLVPAS